jgi:hypothetical protein
MLLEFQIEHLYAKILTKTNNLTCEIPCNVTKYDTVTCKFGKNTCKQPDKCLLYINFRGGTTNVETEYRLMDLADLISATGGLLGLFLGFSFYGGAMDLEACSSSIYGKHKIK